MNLRFVILLLVALGLAGAGAWVANRWVISQTRSEAPQAQSNTVKVVVAANQIKFGSRLEGGQLKLVDWPKDHVPQGAFKDPVEMIGKVTTRGFIEDEIILNESVRKHLGGSHLSALIAEGMRAMSVPVNAIKGVAGFILPGNRVDILHSVEGGVTDTLLKSMKVLAVDQQASTEANKPNVVKALTLEVTPREAEILVQALKTGSLQYTLRNPLDDMVEPEPVKPKPVPVKKPKLKITPPPRPKLPTVKVIPWGKMEVECTTSECAKIKAIPWRGE